MPQRRSRTSAPAPVLTLMDDVDVKLRNAASEGFVQPSSRDAAGLPGKL